jgi:hypothetical protein
MDSVRYLKFKEEVRPYLKMMRQASKTIINEGVSRHPIFVFHHDTLEIGLKLVEAVQTTGQWSVNASTLEEFVARRLIQESKVPAFIETFKDPEKHFCLFVLEGEQAEFVFLPQELTGAN